MADINSALNAPSILYGPPQKVVRSLEELLKKVLDEDIGLLMSKYGFQLWRVWIEQSGLRDELTLFLEIRNGEYVLHHKEMIYYRSFYGMGDEMAYLYHLFHRIAKQIEKEIDKYVANTPIPLRNKNMSYHWNSNLNMQSYMNVVDFNDGKQLTQSISSPMPIGEKIVDSPVQALVARSKNRLKGPAKNISWKFKNF